MTIISKATLPKSGKKAPRKSSSLPAETVEYLKAWMMSPEHIAHPYPTEPEKAQIMADTGIELKQLTNWFVNNRKRYWKPRVEARLQQQARAAAAAAQAHAAAVAVATASVHNNPVSPEAGYKPALPMPPGNGFVTFDLGSPSVTSATTSSSSKLPSRYTHLVETDLARVMADQTANAHHDDEHVVSETSSSGSVTNSEEGNISDATTYQDEETEASYNKSTPSDELHQYEQPDDDTEDHQQQQEHHQQQQQQQSQDYSSEQTTGESSSSASIESTSALVSLAEESMGPIKKRAFATATAPTATEPPRKRFRRISIELWRESCQKAVHVYDDALPSLEEATQLFGYQQKCN
ncbi:MAG: hypothetical protein SGBAC_005679 [Bacillariaceae sp.]